MIKEQDKQEMIADNIQEAYKSIEGKEEITNKLQSKYADRSMGWGVMGAFLGIKSGMLLSDAAQYGFEHMAHPVMAGSTIAAVAIASLASISFSHKSNKQKKEMSELVDSAANSIKTAFSKKDYGLVQRLNAKVSGFWNEDDANKIGARIKEEKSKSTNPKEVRGMSI